jgi:hypothetical protein
VKGTVGDGANQRCYVVLIESQHRQSSSPAPLFTIHRPSTSVALFETTETTENVQQVSAVRWTVWVGDNTNKLYFALYFPLLFIFFNCSFTSFFVHIFFFLHVTRLLLVHLSIRPKRKNKFLPLISNHNAKSR